MVDPNESWQEEDRYLSGGQATFMITVATCIGLALVWRCCRDRAKQTATDTDREQRAAMDSAAHGP